jgi:hypothetical protein
VAIVAARFPSPDGDFTAHDRPSAPSAVKALIKKRCRRLQLFKVFVNYRVGRGDGTATLIEQGLTRRFGPGKIFRASASIPPGARFHQEIMQAVRRSEVLLAVIGPGWTSMEGKQGGRALDNEDDWVRNEILEAFRCGVRVIPVLVGRTPRLTEDVLPPELKQLAHVQDRTFSHANVEGDLDRLADELARLVPGLADDTTPEGDRAPEGGAEDDRAPKPASASPRMNPSIRGSATIVQAEHFNVHGDLFGGSNYQFGGGRDGGAR